MTEPLLIVGVTLAGKDGSFISGGPEPSDPWNEYLITVEDQMVTLSIEEAQYLRDALDEWLAVGESFGLTDRPYVERDGYLPPLRKATAAEAFDNAVRPSPRGSVPVSPPLQQHPDYERQQEADFLDAFPEYRGSRTFNPEGFKEMGTMSDEGIPTKSPDECSCVTQVPGRGIIGYRQRIPGSNV